MVRIKVVAANLEKRQLDYEWIAVAPKEQSLLNGVKDPEKGKAGKIAKPSRKSTNSEPMQTIRPKEKQTAKKTKKAIPETAPIPKAIKRKLK